MSWTLLKTTTRGTESVHWYSRIWPADNRDVTEVKTALPSCIVSGPKARGSPSRPACLCSVVMVSKSVRQRYVTVMWAHSLFHSLLLSFFDFLSGCFTGGLPKRAFCPLTMPGVSWTSPNIYSAKRAVSVNPRTSHDQTHGNNHISCIVGSVHNKMLPLYVSANRHYVKK